MPLVAQWIQLYPGLKTDSLKSFVNNHNIIKGEEAQFRVIVIRAIHSPKYFVKKAINVLCVSIESS